MERARANLFAGGTKFNILIVLCVLALIGWGVAVFSAPYLRKSRLQNIMGDWMREYYKYGYDGMLENIISEAKVAKLPPLTPENFKFEEGEAGRESVLSCYYTESIKLPGGRYYVIKMVAEKRIIIPYH